MTTLNEWITLASRTVRIQNLLPDALLHAISTGQYTSAQVGVCASKQPNPRFTTYNVAVLLY